MTLPNVDTIKAHIGKVADAAADLAAASVAHVDAAAAGQPSPAPTPESTAGAGDGA